MRSLLFVSFNLSLARAVRFKSEASQQQKKCVLKLNMVIFCVYGSICSLCTCVRLLGWSPWCPTVQFHLQHSSLSWISFSHSSSHTYRFCSFPILQDWHLLLLHNTYQMRDVTGADEEKEEDESPIYHVSILSRWIIEKHDWLTRVAWSCVCWLFFGRLSLFTMLHNLFAPLPAWHQPVHLFVCLPPGSRLLLPTAST